MRKLKYLLINILLVSCSTYNYKELNFFEVKDFKDVKSALIFLEHKYRDNGKIEIFFNSKDQRIKQIDYYDKYIMVNEIFYNDRNLISEEIDKYNDTLIVGTKK